MRILMALAGNPNVGKSTLFNRLTGETAHVANWPGVTVELKAGRLRHHDLDITVVDLPGAYGLSSGDEAESVAQEFLLKEKPDVVVIVLDATSLHRSLYLAIRILEMTRKAVLAVNMMDVARRRAIHVDLSGISAVLGVPVVGTSAIRGEGLGSLLDRAIEVSLSKEKLKPLKIDYDGLDPYIAEIERILEDELKELPRRFAAVAVLEGNERILSLLSEEKRAHVLKIVDKVRRELKEDPSVIAIESRYRFVDLLLRDRVKVTRLVSPSIAKKIDRVLLHPIVGPFTSFLLMLSLFGAVFSLNMGFPLNVILSYAGLPHLSSLLEKLSLSGIIGQFLDLLSELLRSRLMMISPEWFVSLLTDGILAGVGSVLTFLPLVLLVFLALGALQDSGLLSRIAVTFDKFLKRFGLSGKSVFPAILGFGCNVPAVMATRAMDDDVERTSVSLSIPFIPCQARLIVLAAISSSVFKEPVVQRFFMMSMYLLSLLVFLITAKFMRYLVRGPQTPELLLEIPPYHVPSLKVVWWYARVNTAHFLRKAGTVIFVVTLIMWALLHLGPSGYTTSIDNSFAAISGRALSFIGAPIGLGDWRIILTLEAGFLAKEAVLSTMTTIAGTAKLSEAVNVVLSSVKQAISLCLIMLIYVPCIATLSVMKSEVKKIKLVLVAISYELLLAYLMAAAAYHLL